MHSYPSDTAEAMSFTTITLRCGHQRRVDRTLARLIERGHVGVILCDGCGHNVIATPDPS